MKTTETPYCKKHRRYLWHGSCIYCEWGPSSRRRPNDRDGSGLGVDRA